MPDVILPAKQCHRAARLHAAARARHLHEHVGPKVIPVRILSIRYLVSRNPQR
jgi:hypothetical protein